MFELTIRTTFSAAHAIVIRGVREPLHGHDWRITLTLAGDHLDEDGLLVDFHDAERVLHSVVAPFRNANLNDTPPFDAINPTAERVAEHIARAVAARLGGPARVVSCRVTEAPGCAATFRMPA